MMRFRLALTMLALGLIPTAGRADDLTYLVHAPAQATPHPPLIVLMHGAGSDERDMVTMWRDLPPDFAVISPRGPFRSGRGYVWYRKQGATPRDADLAMSQKIIDLVVDNAVKRFDADPKRVFIGGFSQGGVMTYQIALHEPGKFRGAVVLSGLMFPSALADAKPGAPPFFIGHGTADTRIPYAAATSARDALAKRRVPVTFHTYPGMGHETTAAESTDLRGWLESLGRSETPKP